MQPTTASLPSRRTWLRWLFAAGLAPLAAGLAAGCARAPKLEPVHGVVTVEGKPLSYGTITFIPDAAQGNTSPIQPRGVIQPDGAYTLHSGDKPGAAAGRYQVTIFAVKPTTPEEGIQPPTWGASQKYSAAETSGLSVQVTAAPPEGGYNFHLVK